MLAVAHIIACAVTSAQQLTDTVRPPSKRKKHHLLVKWITGAVLAVALCMHIFMSMQVDSAQAQSQPFLVSAHLFSAVLVSAAVAVHVCFGAKSLLKDLNIDKRYRMPLRVFFCVLAGAFAIALTIALFSN